MFHKQNRVHFHLICHIQIQKSQYRIEQFGVNLSWHPDEHFYEPY